MKQDTVGINISDCCLKTGNDVASGCFAVSFSDWLFVSVDTGTFGIMVSVLVVMVRIVSWLSSVFCGGGSAF